MRDNSKARDKVSMHVSLTAASSRYRDIFSGMALNDIAGRHNGYLAVCLRLARRWNGWKANNHIISNKYNVLKLDTIQFLAVLHVNEYALRAFPFCHGHNILLLEHSRISSTSSFPFVKWQQAYTESW